MCAHIQGKGYGSSTIVSEVSQAMKLLKSNAKLVIDIGGNIGNYTSQIRKLCPDTEIHIFEPSSFNYNILQEKFRNDPNIYLINSALSNLDGFLTLYFDVPGSGSSSLVKRNLDHLNVKFELHETVKVSKFSDYWINNLNNQIIDLVKIDVEGFELETLKGFGEVLFNTKLIQFEFGGCNIDTRTYFQDFWYFFNDKNFEIYRITPFGLQFISKYGEMDEFFSTTNYLALNKNLML